MAASWKIDLRVKIMWRDDTLPHQIRIFLVGGSSRNDIGVSCVCRRNGHGGAQGECYEPLEARARWDWPDAKAVYDAHLEPVLRTVGGHD
jgi:hypothetical protein